MPYSSLISIQYLHIFCIHICYMVYFYDYSKYFHDIFCSEDYILHEAYSISILEVHRVNQDMLHVAYLGVGNQGPFLVSALVQFQVEELLLEEGNREVAYLVVADHKVLLLVGEDIHEVACLEVASHKEHLADHGEHQEEDNPEVVLHARL